MQCSNPGRVKRFTATLEVRIGVGTHLATYSLCTVILSLGLRRLWRELNHSTSRLRIGGAIPPRSLCTIIAWEGTALPFHTFRLFLWHGLSEWSVDRPCALTVVWKIAESMHCIFLLYTVIVCILISQWCSPSDGLTSRRVRESCCKCSSNIFFVHTKSNAIRRRWWNRDTQGNMFTHMFTLYCHVWNNCSHRPTHCCFWCNIRVFTLMYF